MTWPEPGDGPAAGTSPRAGSPTFSLEGILGDLRASGLRVTKNRRKILEALFESRRPLSLEEIQDAARGRGGNPDFATVFRTVALLERRGWVHKVNLQRPRSYFELRDPARHYDHIVCTKCGRVVVLEEPCPLADYEKSIARKHGFRGVRHSLEFFGICADC